MSHTSGRGTDAALLAERIRKIATAIGYTSCGFTACEFFPGYAKEVQARANAYPDASAVYRKLRHRADPQATAPWAHSIVVAIRPYNKYRLPKSAIGHIGRNYLADRRVPGCPDHDMPKKMTAALRGLGLRVRRGGTPDRAAAVRAGVVATGRNGFAYSPEWGSWINIETWRVDKPLPPPGEQLPCPCPEDCRACLRACPTRALFEPFKMRLDRCIAYLTYEAPEPLDAELEKRMGAWVYGCDVCQEVCPLNRKARRLFEPAPWLEEIEARLSPRFLAEMELETYLKVIHPRFWYIADSERGWQRWRRNAARALAFTSV